MPSRYTKVNCQTAKRATNLCGKESCELCFNKSFASHPKSKCWDSEKNGEVKPINIGLGTHKEYWFICDVKECNHEFRKSINLITNKTKPSFCLYCAGKALCGKEECKTCYERSFASHPKAKYLHPIKNGKVNPINIFKKSSKKYWFNCDKCSHKFESTLSNITKKNKPRWCKYCAHRGELCKDDDCTMCYENSFASHPKAEYWNYKKNKGKPRDFFKSANKEFYFNCDECKHELYRTLNSICNRKWCQYCAGKELCKDDNCTICYNRSFASHPKSKFWNYEKNEGKPRDFAKGSKNQCFFDCDECSHTFETKIMYICSKTKKHQSWCPYCCKPQKK